MGFWIVEVSKSKVKLVRFAQDQIEFGTLACQYLIINFTFRCIDLPKQYSRLLLTLQCLVVTVMEGGHT